MRIGYNIRRLHDVARALFIQKKLTSHDRWTRRKLQRFQDQQLSSLVEHAVNHSPFYKELYRNIRTDRGVFLHDLPVINKAAMMDNFDRFVTDPRLKLAELQAHIRQLTRDEYYRGEYRVITTSGSSGLKGVFVSSRKEWCTALAGFLRCASFMGVSPRLPNRRRITTIGADSPMHVTYRMSVSSDVGLIKAQRLAATSSIRHLVEALNAFQPEFLGAYPSIASLLAEEQLEGRLRIRPRVVSTLAEVRTADMEQKIRQAWGIAPFDNYGMTEAGIVFGSDCPHHQGVHVFEDLFIVEVVNEQNEAVPDGSPGYKLLITNLFNFTQPLVRYEVSDMITMSTESCPCGRPFRLVAKVEGRSDDIIYLQGKEGQEVPVHPIHFHSTMGPLQEIKQYEIIHEEDGIHISVSLRDRVGGEESAGKLRKNLMNNLESLGAKCPDIHIHFVDKIERDPGKMGKLKLVRSNVRRRGK